MTEVKRFVKWLIDNDIAFTHIAEAVEAFHKQTEKPLLDWSEMMKSDSTIRFTSGCQKEDYTVIY